MRRLVSDSDLLDQLSEVFRCHGYDRASLTHIAKATGLQRSSLYHRFPGGKEQMAAEVAGRVAERFGEQVLGPLADDRPLELRLEAVAVALLRFYDGGRVSCFLDILSLGSAGSAANQALAGAARGWLDAFASAAQEGGCSAAEARRRAGDAVAGIEGGLVLARVTGDQGPFRQAVQRLATTLSGREAA